MIVLFAHVRTGRWASVMPAKLAETLGLTDTIRAIPIVEPEAVHTIGLVVPAREPMTPLTAALVESREAQRDRARMRAVEAMPLATTGRQSWQRVTPPSRSCAGTWRAWLRRPSRS